MQRQILVRGLILSSLMTYCATSFAASAATAHAKVKHMDPEMTGREYLPLVRDLIDAEDASSPRLQAILVVGKRNLEWIDHINSLRTENKLELSSAATQTGYPIDAPTFNSEGIVLQKYDAWLASTPESISNVLTGQGAYPDAPPVADEIFIERVRLIDRIYQSASRWLLQVPYLEEYATLQKNDIRGYYFLSREADLEAKLGIWVKLSDADRARLTPWLVGQCFNVEEKTLAECQAELEAAANAGTVTTYFQAYLPTARTLYDSFFKIPVSRTDMTWNSSDVNLATIPFANPANDAVLNWLRDNIEDEWKWNGWQLRLNFVETTDENTTHIEFEEGTTPHVNDLAGSIITMDANRALDEYSSRWTIRHEYGHVLGFPDCYVEFFDATAQVMVNYQLDIENLMCSRRGHLQQTHFDEMKRVYFSDTSAGQQSH